MVFSLHRMYKSSKPYFDIAVCGIKATVLLDSGANRIVFFQDKKWFDSAFRKAPAIIYIGRTTVKGLGDGPSSGDEYLVPVFTLSQRGEVITIYNARVVLSNMEHSHSIMLLGMGLFSNANVHINRDCDNPFISLTWRNSGTIHLMRDDVDVSDIYDQDEFNWKSPYNLARIMLGFYTDENILRMFGRRCIDPYYFESYYNAVAKNQDWHFDGFTVLSLSLAAGYLKTLDGNKCVEHITDFYDSIPEATKKKYVDMYDAFVQFYREER